MEIDMEITIEGRKDIMDLEADVIYNGLCCYCGTCGAFCDYIDYENEIPVARRKCKEICGACYEFCPRTFFEPFEVEKAVFGEIRRDNLLGYYKRIVTARAKDEEIRGKGQDGGVVSALLVDMIERDEIDAAVVSSKSERWVPEPFVATGRQEILSAAGSKYTQCPSVLGVKYAFDRGHERIAFVGLPCHIQGMRKVQLSPRFDVGAERVKVMIGLLCSETFEMHLLEKKLEDLGTSIEDVEKFNIKHGKFIIHTKEKEIKTPIKDMRECMREACKYCYDFAAEFADISVGSIGSELGWSTVIVRSELGEKIVRNAEKSGIIEVREMSDEKINEVRKLASHKKRSNLKNILGKTGKIKILNMIFSPEFLEMLLNTDAKN